MRSDVVILPDELLGLTSDLVKVLEEVSTQHIVTVSSVEAFGV
jgi:hypothetical protein